MSQIKIKSQEVLKLDPLITSKHPELKIIENKIFNFDSTINFNSKNLAVIEFFNSLNQKIIYSLDIDSILEQNKVHLFKNAKKKHPLFMAFNYIIKIKKLKDKPTLNIIDATAGLLGDSLWLLSLFPEKCHIIAIEKDILLSFLIQNALNNTSKKIQNFINFKNDNSLEFLKDYQDPIDILFIDPMFKHKKEKSLPRKDIQLISKRGEFLDIHEYLKLNQNIIVKCSKFDSELDSLATEIIKGKNIILYIFLAKDP